MKTGVIDAGGGLRGIYAAGGLRGIYAAGVFDRCMDVPFAPS